MIPSIKIVDWKAKLLFHKAFMELSDKEMKDLESFDAWAAEGIKSGRLNKKMSLFDAVESYRGRN